QNAWLVLGFDECDQALRDGETFGSHNRRESLTEERWNDLSVTLGGERALVLLPEPEHSRLVTLIRRRMALNVPHYRATRIQPVIDHLLAGLIERGGGEFASEFSDPVPSAVIASVLGLPWEDPDLLMQWKVWDAMTVELVSRFDRRATDESRRVAAEISEVLLPIVRARREQPEDDFISQLWEVVPTVLEDCTDEDIVAQCRQLFLGGSHSTSFLLNNCAVLLFSDPERWQDLKLYPDKVGPFVDEVLRVIGVVQQRPRVVTKDTVLGGQQLRAGDHVYLMLPAANRDPEHYSCPFAVSLDPADRKRHLGFGAGPKTCAGMALARVEITDVFTTLLRSIDNPRLDPAAEAPSFDVESVTAAWRPLNVNFDDIRASAAVA
ncbi:MAG: cytochrome P450, partial [Microbacterium sp.]